MPRTSRLIVIDAKAVYHVMSRTALDGFSLKDVEKDFMLDLIKKSSALLSLSPLIYLPKYIGLLT